MTTQNNHFDIQSSNILYQSFLFSAKVLKNNKNNKLRKPTKTEIYNFRNTKTKPTNYFVGYNQIIYLPKRQTECLQMLKNNSSKKIAEHLGLSVRTVENYLSLLRKKLRCKNKQDLHNLAATMKVINA